MHLVQQSTLLIQDDSQFTSHERPCILNRQCSNVELVFNPYAAFDGKFDKDFNKRWLQVDRCMYTNQDRYVMVMYNQEELRANDFIEVEGQEQLMKDLDDKFPLSQNNAAPIIFANRQANLMIHPAIFASLLILS